MIKVVGVKFRNAGKIYYFNPKDMELAAGQDVIVETANGIEYGKVLMSPRFVEDEEITNPLKDVIRVANDEDKAQDADNRKKEEEALIICQEKVDKHNPEMKLISAEYAFDRSKVLFNFTAEGRVDFRELVKDLASVFRTRIELRQIGVRDETKICGGIGICGRELCCCTYLSDFASVSIKMAKEQGLSLNPTKISGLCGRLMCCLKNESETYEELNKALPDVGAMVTTPDGVVGQVQSVNVLRQLVKVLITIDDEKELKEYHVSDIRFKHRCKKCKAVENDGTEEFSDLE